MGASMKVETPNEKGCAANGHLLEPPSCDCCQGSGKRMGGVVGGLGRKERKGINKDNGRSAARVLGFSGVLGV
jgi:hypothetical protein